MFPTSRQIFFNVFLPPDDPLHVGKTPREFRPIDPPLDRSKVAFTPEYFEPSTTIASDGVKVTKRSNDSL